MTAALIKTHCLLFMFGNLENEVPPNDIKFIHRVTLTFFPKADVIVPIVSPQSTA